jgi:hypothetical protein
VTDDQHRIVSLPAERDQLIAQRDCYADDLAELLEVAHGVRAAANTALDLEPKLALALDELSDVIDALEQS